MSPIDEVPTPTEPRAPGYYTVLLALGAWAVLAAAGAFSYLLWEWAGFPGLVVGWLLLLSAVGFVVGAVSR